MLFRLLSSSYERESNQMNAVERVIISFRSVTDTFLDHKRDTGSLKTRELKGMMIVIDDIEDSNARR